MTAFGQKPAHLRQRTFSRKYDGTNDGLKCIMWLDNRKWRYSMPCLYVLNCTELQPCDLKGS